VFEERRVWHSGAGVGGFTLIELAIVLVLAGLILSLAGLTFGECFERSSARRAAQVFARDLTLARSSAIRARESVVVCSVESSRWYQVVVQTSGPELVRRRFGVNADMDVSAIDPVFPGDTVVVNSRGMADMSGIRSSLGEARFASGAPEYGVYFNSMGASKVEVR
jgi:prepilin-type N-terminal cleavage/methylation domain-containing protein